MWHGAGGDAVSFETLLTGSHDAHGYVLVTPEGAKKYDSEWRVEPAGATDDLDFFEDVLRCLWEQVPIDLRRVHSMGFSVGGRFTGYLMGHRSNAVGSVVAWSGGDRTPQGVIVVPMPAHPIPALLYHGGSTDTPACCGQNPTEALANKLKANGDFVVVCNHGAGHTYPPNPGRVTDLWRFIESHPFLPGAASSWREAGLPAGLPNYCQIR